MEKKYHRMRIITQCRSARIGRGVAEDQYGWKAQPDINTLKRAVVPALLSVCRSGMEGLREGVQIGSRHNTPSPYHSINSMNFILLPRLTQCIGNAKIGACGASQIGAYGASRRALCIGG
jgi:hypothetical protein